MKRVLIAGAVMVFTLALMVNSQVEGGKDKDKEKDKEKVATIKEVMKKAHAKGALLDKFKEGKASSEEKKQLISLYEALAANTPPKGEAAAWKEKTEALVKAVKTNDVEAVKKAASCAACHSEFKGKKK